MKKTANIALCFIFVIGNRYVNLFLKLKKHRHFISQLNFYCLPPTEVRRNGMFNSTIATAHENAVQRLNRASKCEMHTTI